MKRFRNVLAERLSAYVELRRGPGLKFAVQADILHKFDRYLLEREYDGLLTQEIAIDFATHKPSIGKTECARRYQVVRNFSEYLATFEPRTPPMDPKALRRSKTRPPAHIFTDGELKRVLHEARHISAKNPLRGVTLHTMVGLAVSTGLRISEVVRLDKADADHLETGRGNGARTRNARLAAVRSFFRHVACSDPASMGVARRVLAIEGKRTIKRAPHYLRHDELDAVVAAPDRSTPLGRRDHALLLFLGRTGARASEAVGVNASDLRLERPWQVLLRGKGSKERVIPLREDTAAVLRALCDERGIKTDDDAPVFVNARGQRLTRHGAYRIVQRAAEVASRACPALANRSVSPHTLRHTVAMRLLQSGVDLSVVRSWLGHVSLDTTHQYVEADVEMKRRALEKCEDPEAQLSCYRPTDAVLALLESL